MAKIKIKLTEEHLKLIKSFTIERINDIHIGFDTINPYGGNYLMEDLAMILGYWDKATIGSELDYDGKKFGLENEIEMIKIHSYLMDNFSYVMSIIIQFATEGIKPGLYTSIDYNINWTYIPITFKTGEKVHLKKQDFESPWSDVDGEVVEVINYMFDPHTGDLAEPFYSIKIEGCEETRPAKSKDLIKLI